METKEPTVRALRRVAVGGLALLGAGLLAGCLGDSTTGSSGGGTAPVSLSVSAGARASGPASVAPSFDISVTDGPNDLVMDRIDIVIRQLRLKPDDVTSCGAGGDDCVEYRGEAALLPLPTEAEVLTLATRSVATGRYDRVDLSIHAPSAGEPVVDDNPEFENVSVRIEGTYNGEAFTFTSDVTAEPRLPMDPALVIDSETFGANVTFLVGVSGWFLAEGGGLVDPRTANEGGANEGLVESNIESSFQAFRDDDQDGAPGTTGQ